MVKVLALLVLLVAAEAHSQRAWLAPQSSCEDTLTVEYNYNAQTNRYERSSIWVSINSQNPSDTLFVQRPLTGAHYEVDTFLLTADGSR